jgi:hypothetical protein
VGQRLFDIPQFFEGDADTDLKIGHYRFLIVTNRVSEHSTGYNFAHPCHNTLNMQWHVQLLTMCRFRDSSRQIREWTYEKVCVRCEPHVTPATIADAQIAGNSVKNWLAINLSVSIYRVCVTCTSYIMNTSGSFV